MKKSKFSPAQVDKILQQHDSGKPAAQVCREHGITHATLYSWKKHYGGLKSLRKLEEGKARLKRLLAEFALDQEMAKDIISKKL